MAHVWQGRGKVTHDINHGWGVTVNCSGMVHVSHWGSEMAEAEDSMFCLTRWLTPYRFISKSYLILEVLQSSSTSS